MPSSHGSCSASRATAASTARTVDSSLERLQVKVAGATGDRFTVACNGYPLPLTNTATSGEAVAGVRFRAFRPTHGFHPTIGPHVPLTFDIVDTWTGRSIGGCRYHATHPARSQLSERPVNALEAEARRPARFETMGHSPGASAPRAAAAHPDFPLTLDLRVRRVNPSAPSHNSVAQAQPLSFDAAPTRRLP